MSTTKALPLATALAAALFSAASLGAEGEWKYSTGIDYSSGDYGGDPVDTKITYIPFTTSYSTGNWQFKATVPWVEIEGAGTVIGAGDGGVVINNGNTRSTTESGLGDIWLGASYQLDSIPTDLFFMDLGAKVKLPTADEDKGLGTGETDYTVQADFYKPMGNVMPFATVAYKIKGDPSGLDLDNVFYLSAGSDFTLSERQHAGFSLDYQEAATARSDDSLEAVAYLSHTLSQPWSLMVYGYKGLADGSPDYGAGVQISYKH